MAKKTDAVAPEGADQKPPQEEVKETTAAAAARKEQSFEEKHAALIQQKVNAGLTREGAIEVIKHQIENDARKAAKKKNN